VIRGEAIDPSASGPELGMLVHAAAETTTAITPQRAIRKRHLVMLP